jgi:hypothetical protein
MQTHLQVGILVGGPQDGAKVKGVGGALPQIVHVGPRWLGDGYAAWSREPCDRFPACYVLDGYRYMFRGYDRGPKPC